MTSGSSGRPRPGRTAHRLHDREVQAPVGRRHRPGEVRPDRRPPLRIGGIYQANALIGSYLVSAGFFLAHFQHPASGRAAAAHQRQRRRGQAVTNALAPYPNVQVQTRAQYEQAQTASVNQLLGLVYALLALAVIIALIGIVNTLMLSVFERTREIGLLRAVGMRRRQVRTMIRSEAVILAIFGAIIGIVIGTGDGHRPGVVAETAGHHRHRRPGLHPGDFPDPRRRARPDRGQLARPPGGASWTCWPPSPPSSAHARAARAGLSASTTARSAKIS